MNKQFPAYFTRLTIAIFLALAPVALTIAQMKTTGALTVNVAGNPLVALPSSDAVMFVDMQRLLSDVGPRLFAADPTMLARMKSDMASLKESTGLDLHTVDTVAVGVRFDQQLKNQKMIVIIRGRFDAASLVAAKFAKMKADTKVKVKEGTYNGRTIYTEDAPQSGSALVVLDKNTIAVSDLEMVRAAVDAGAGDTGKRVEAELVERATRDSNALMGFAGNRKTASYLSQQFGGLSDKLNRALTSIEQFDGSVSAPGNSGELLATLRTESAAQAQQITELFAPLKQIPDSVIDAKPGLIPMVDGFARLLWLFKDLNVTAQGNEVTMKLELPFTKITRFRQR